MGTQHITPRLLQTGDNPPPRLPHHCRQPGWCCPLPAAASQLTGHECHPGTARAGHSRMLPQRQTPLAPGGGGGAQGSGRDLGPWTPGGEALWALSWVTLAAWCWGRQVLGSKLPRGTQTTWKLAATPAPFLIECSRYLGAEGATEGGLLLRPRRVL